MLAALALLALQGIVAANQTNRSVVWGSARFTVLTPKVIRLEYSGSFPPHFDDLPSTLVLDRAPGTPPAFTHAVVHVPGTNDIALTLNTSALSLRFIAGAFTARSLSITLRDSGTVWRPGADSSGNLNGSLNTMDCYPDWEQCIEFHQQQMQPGIVSRDGWSVIDDTHSFLFDSDPSFPPNGWRVRRDHAEQYSDWVFFGHGRNYTEALGDFTAISGRVPMMPWNAYGVWWSRYWAYNETGIRAVIEGYESHDLPLNYLVLDVDWHRKLGETTGCCKPTVGTPAICENPTYQAGYGGYSWDRNLFPDPVEFTRWLHEERNLSLLLNLHDAYGEDHCQRSYAEVARAVGVDPSTNQTLACSFEDKKLQVALHHFELESGENAGVDAWWTDYGNWNIPLFSQPGWQCELDAAPFGQGTRDFSSPASLWSSYVRTSRLLQKGKRAFRLGIYGGIGSHRYPLVGSGDTIASWPTLGWEVYMTITGSNVATAWTHDLGGFISCEDATCQKVGQTQRDPEQFLRWLQFGVFSPIFRTHCDHCEIRPWLYANFEALAPVYRLRNALVPYLYTAQFKATTTGVIPVHPLYYDYPEHDESYSLSAFGLETTFNTSHHSVAQCRIDLHTGQNAEGLLLSNSHTATAEECAEACCNKSACGGFTWDPKQADKTGAPACPEGEACCWLKQHGTTLHSGTARFISGARDAQPGGPDGRTNVFASTLEYSFGDDMVAAPVIKPVNKTTGLASQKMWVPPGEWILWQTGESHSGPQTINMQAKQTDIPVLVKAGAVLPLKTMASVSDIAPDPLVLQVLGCGSSASVCDGAGSVYEDDGVSVGYTQSEYRLARVTQNSSGTTTTVTITPRAEGNGYTGEPTRRAYQLELLTGAMAPKTVSVSVDGKPLQQIAPADGRARARGWWHDNATGLFGGTLLVVGTGELSTADMVRVRVQR